MLLFSEGFQPKNVLALFFLSMKRSYLLADREYFNMRSIKLYTPTQHPITSQKMYLTVFRSFFCNLEINFLKEL